MNQIQTHRWPSDWPLIHDATYGRLNAHHESWINSIGKGLRHQTYLVTANCGDQATGVLPLNLVSGPLFGRFLVSIPYVNTGGVWAKDNETAVQLIDAACDLADELDVNYLELRHESPVDHPRLNFERTEKVHMRMPLPETTEGVMKNLKSKVRSQVKKSGEFGLQVNFGADELLDSFYAVFAHNMRDLGTPVFACRLFAHILHEFGDNAEICVVRKNSRPVAAALLVHADGVSEVPSASCLREFNRMNANMLMYRHLLERAVERRSHTFDFGRSSEGSGTYKFKAQWGAVPHPACWQYYVRKGDPNDMRPDSDGKQRLVKIWQRLPVWLTKMIGPTIVRGIP
ncbi:FemAB family XrtA/PEP-CTERM system-associated protein [Rhodopirellula sp. SWK7]|uniref:FemAB family XrtA/PEP-CTERM system-associated protein n=1 Tax=Rhodopirellula sp. SWK7 TaxID=595460 RepID=UPI0002BDBF79|nr:FemAB family XrtA/PEP-CTERM system-associated protein [Rhodopirellula sp. SWK7]EMI44576.1 FemAB-related protein, PEP-CTERM system-associated [Rhodopirellula sp. SWK7]